MPTISYSIQGQAVLLNHWEDPRYFTVLFRPCSPTEERPVSLMAYAECDEVTDSVLLALELTRREVVETRATNIYEDPLRNTTWEYFQAAKRTKHLMCGERCVDGRLKTDTLGT